MSHRAEALRRLSSQLSKKLPPPSTHFPFVTANPPALPFPPPFSPTSPLARLPAPTLPCRHSPFSLNPPRHRRPLTTRRSATAAAAWGLGCERPSRRSDSPCVCRPWCLGPIAKGKVYAVSTQVCLLLESFCCLQSLRSRGPGPALACLPPLPRLPGAGRRD